MPCGTFNKYHFYLRCWKKVAVRGALRLWTMVATRILSHTLSSSAHSPRSYGATYKQFIISTSRIGRTKLRERQTIAPSSIQASKVRSSARWHYHSLLILFVSMPNHFIYYIYIHRCSHQATQRKHLLKIIMILLENKDYFADNSESKNKHPTDFQPSQHPH